jgi:Phosphodiester glycosidase
MKWRNFAVTYSFVLWSAVGFGGSPLTAFAESELVAVKKVLTEKIFGLTVEHKNLSSSTSGDFKITYIVADPKKFHLALAIPSDPASGGSSLGRFIADEHAIAALSGGFLRTVTPATPAGLLKFGGNLLNRLSPEVQLGGIVCFFKKGDRVKFTTPSDGQILSEAEDCLQAGPLLVADGSVKDDLEEIDLNGLNRRFSSGKYSRSFLASTGNGEFVLGLTTPTPLFALRKFMLMPVTEGGIGAVDAINLTGGATAGLMIKGEPPFVAGGAATDLLFPDAIVLK